MNVDNNCCKWDFFSLHQSIPESVIYLICDKIPFPFRKNIKSGFFPEWFCQKQIGNRSYKCISQVILIYFILHDFLLRSLPISRSMAKICDSASIIVDKDFFIPEGIYEATVVNFNSQFPVDISINGIPIPNAILKFGEDIHSKTIRWTITCHSPEKLCYSYKTKKQLISTMHYTYDFNIYQPVCHKPLCQINCSLLSPCVIQLKGYHQ